jgi:hypothetical protein
MVLSSASRFASAISLVRLSFSWLVKKVKKKPPLPFRVRGPTSGEAVPQLGGPHPGPIRTSPSTLVRIGATTKPPPASRAARIGASKPRGGNIGRKRGALCAERQAICFAAALIWQRTVPRARSRVIAVAIATLMRGGGGVGDGGRGLWWKSVWSHGECERPKKTGERCPRAGRADPRADLAAVAYLLRSGALLGQSFREGGRRPLLSRSNRAPSPGIAQFSWSAA